MSILIPEVIKTGHDCAQTRTEHVCITCSVRQLSICGALENSELADFERLSRSVDVDARATLFSENEPANHVFNITSGVVRLYKQLPDGRRQIVGFALPGDFLGLALMETYSVNADAVTAVKTCKFTRTGFSDYLDLHPSLLRRLHEMAAHELSLAQDQMVVLGRHSADERLAIFLLNLKERYQRIGESGITIKLPMSRQDIADYLGLTIETVSRTIGRLAKAKLLLVVPDSIRLLDIEGLHRIAHR